MRQNWLTNRVVKGHDDILAHSREAWNTLLDRPRMIMPIGLRDWAAVGLTQ